MTERTDIIANALRSYSQGDMEGVMVLVSRQACEEGADALEALDAENARLRELLGEAGRAMAIHTFSPSGHEHQSDRDTCRRCGEDFRCRDHIRMGEDIDEVKATALENIRAALKERTS